MSFDTVFIFDVFKWSTEALFGRVGFFIVRFLGNSSSLFIFSRETASRPRVGFFIAGGVLIRSWGYLLWHRWRCARGFSAKRVPKLIARHAGLPWTMKSCRLWLAQGIRLPDWRATSRFFYCEVFWATHPPCSFSVGKELRHPGWVFYCGGVFNPKLGLMW